MSNTLVTVLSFCNLSNQKLNYTALNEFALMTIMLS